MAYQAYKSVAQTTLGGSSIEDEYIPLWIFSSGSVGMQTPSAAGSSFVPKGASGTGSSVGPTVSSAKLHQLSSLWSPSQKFALECSFYSSNAANMASVALWDLTAGAIVPGSTITTTNTTFTLIRSGTFTLTPGHTYGVTYWNSNTTYYVYLTKAQLVALMQ